LHGEESAAHSSALLTKICAEERIDKTGVSLHSDNGGPMKGATMLVTMQRLGVMPSFSRPSVSNDNPFCVLIVGQDQLEIGTKSRVFD